MTRFSKFFLLVVMVGLLTVMMPTFAQEEEMIDPGTGNPIVLANFGADLRTLNPIVSADGTSSTVWSRFYPNFIGLDFDTGNYGPNVPKSIIESWSISEDGLTYTFKLREDLFWTDGTPITSADVQYAYDALASGEVNSPRTVIADVAESFVSPDDYTVVITLKEATCAAMTSLAGNTFVVPSHVYKEWFPNFSDMNESRYNTTAPPATWGPWNFRNFRPGEQVTLTANLEYPDAALGPGLVMPEGWIYRNIASQALIFELFVAGELTYGGIPEARVEDARALAAEGGAVLYESTLVNLRFISLNLANPDNPLPGLDEEGNPIPQDPHPILGDVRVRQALNYAMDFEALNQAAFRGLSYQLPAFVRPDSWAYDPSIEAYPFDLEMADQLLTEAGWIDHDGDPSTPRIAQGALYAADGTELVLRFNVNSGNLAQETMGLILQDQWGQAGFGIDFEAIDFNVMVGELLGQTYDLSSVFFGISFPSEPHSDLLKFTAIDDVPDSTFNTSSFYHPEFEDLIKRANDPTQTNGCDTETRAELYRQAYSIFKEQSPWIVFGSTSTQLIQTGIGNFEVHPTFGIGFAWNDNAWIIGD